MHSPLTIINFKSIKDIRLECKKVNIFIGEPNAGKSNIIEGISLLSDSILDLSALCRYRTLSDLFFDNQTGQGILVRLGDQFSEISWSSFERIPFNFLSGHHMTPVYQKRLEATGKGEIKPFISENQTGINLYKFNSSSTYRNPNPGKLLPPFGENLFSIIATNEAFRSQVRDIFRPLGFKLNIRPDDLEVLISKEKGEDIFSYSFQNISETLRRIVFFRACLETNQNSTILFDEPEANTFPFYTKYLAERIALDESNQYFLTTHNPYLLRSIVEKTKKDDLNVCVTYMEDYTTKVRPLSVTELDEVLDIDSFFNLDLFLKK